MIQSNSDTLDIVKELRLRQWARRHYVPSAERSSAWHPVVLDEMALRDAELQSVARVQKAASLQASLSFVPLAPSRYHEIHAGHDALTEPKLVTRRRSQRV